MRRRAGPAKAAIRRMGLRKRTGRILTFKHSIPINRESCRMHYGQVYGRRRIWLSGNRGFSRSGNLTRRNTVKPPLRLPGASRRARLLGGVRVRIHVWFCPCRQAPPCGRGASHCFARHVPEDVAHACEANPGEISSWRGGNTRGRTAHGPAPIHLPFIASGLSMPAPMIRDPFSFTGSACRAKAGCWPGSTWPAG